MKTTVIKKRTISAIVVMVFTIISIIFTCYIYDKTIFPFLTLELLVTIWGILMTLIVFIFGVLRERVVGRNLLWFVHKKYCWSKYLKEILIFQFFSIVIAFLYEFTIIVSNSVFLWLITFLAIVSIGFWLFIVYNLCSILYLYYEMVQLVNLDANKKQGNLGKNIIKYFDFCLIDLLIEQRGEDTEDRTYKEIIYFLFIRPEENDDNKKIMQLKRIIESKVDYYKNLTDEKSRLTNQVRIRNFGKKLEEMTNLALLFQVYIDNLDIALKKPNTIKQPEEIKICMTTVSKQETIVFLSTFLEKNVNSTIALTYIISQENWIPITLFEEKEDGRRENIIIFNIVYEGYAKYLKSVEGIFRSGVERAILGSENQYRYTKLASYYLQLFLREVEPSQKIQQYSSLDVVQDSYNIERYLVLESIVNALSVDGVSECYIESINLYEKFLADYKCEVNQELEDEIKQMNLTDKIKKNEFLSVIYFEFDLQDFYFSPIEIGGPLLKSSILQKNKENIENHIDVLLEKWDIKNINEIEEFLAQDDVEMEWDFYIRNQLKKFIDVVDEKLVENEKNKIKEYLLKNTVFIKNDKQMKTWLRQEDEIDYFQRMKEQRNNFEEYKNILKEMYEKTTIFFDLGNEVINCGEKYFYLETYYEYVFYLMGNSEENIKIRKLYDDFVTKKLWNKSIFAEYVGKKFVKLNNSQKEEIQEFYKVIASENLTSDKLFQINLFSSLVNDKTDTNISIDLNQDVLNQNWEIVVEVIEKNCVENLIVDKPLFEEIYNKTIYLGRDILQNLKKVDEINRKNEEMYLPSMSFYSKILSLLGIELLEKLEYILNALQELHLEYINKNDSSTINEYNFESIKQFATLIVQIENPEYNTEYKKLTNEIYEEIETIYRATGFSETYLAELLTQLRKKRWNNLPEKHLIHTPMFDTSNPKKG